MSVLDPENRCLYTDALRPPPGFRFAEAIAATYSLDLETLLTIPLHLCLFSSDRPLEELLTDGVALREALRKTADRISVYAQAGRLLAPATHRTLFSLLEPTVIEVMPPASGGSFHPKFWLIRFEDTDDERDIVRLLVLTRNITNDRCWDLALSLDGIPARQPREENSGLVRLVTTLPTFSNRTIPPARVEQAERLAGLAHRAEWDLPRGFDQVRFHALGLDGSVSWVPRKSGKLAVISPFVADAALRDVTKTSDEPIALISRPEELDRLDGSTLERFDRVMVLADQAETLEGDEEADVPGSLASPIGLHAKAYFVQTGWHTHLYVGSANATNPALVHGANIELMAELKGSFRKPAVGGVDELLGPDGLGPVLLDYEPKAPDPKVLRAAEIQGVLEAARQSIVASGLIIRFARSGDVWTVEIRVDQPGKLSGVGDMKAWLVTRPAASAASVRDLMNGQVVRLPDAPIQLLTTFVALELTSAVDSRESLRFVLSLPAEGLPVEERDAAVTRDIIRNREGFLRYLLLLLSDFENPIDLAGSSGGGWIGRGDFTRLLDHEGPLFEHLTRTFCHDPERLHAVRRLIEDLGRGEQTEIIPREFLDLWQTFEEAIESRKALEA